MGIEYSWTICLVLVLLACVQLMLGYIMGALRERRHWKNPKSTTTVHRRTRQLVQWVCGVLGESSAESSISLTSMTRICDRLEKLDELPTAEVTQLMIDVVNEVVRSNELLRDQIASLRIQLQQQGTELESQHSQAVTDSLTGLPNRRALDKSLTHRFTEWKTLRTPLSVILIDIDRFKQLNDTLGHLAGDRVLKKVANILRKSFRSTDLVARFGGEEFAIVLPQCRQEVAEQATLSAMREVERAAVMIDGSAVNVTVSAGLVIAKDQSSITELLRQADEALYASKQGGRNCAHVFADGGCHLVECNGSNVNPGEAFTQGATDQVSLSASLEEHSELSSLSSLLKERLEEIESNA